MLGGVGGGGGGGHVEIMNMVNWTDEIMCGEGVILSHVHTV